MMIFFGVPAVSVGTLRPGEGDEVVVDGTTRPGLHGRRFVLRDGRLIGYFGVGSIELAGLFHQAIRERLGFEDLPPDILRRRGRLGMIVRMSAMRG